MRDDSSRDVVALILAVAIGLSAVLISVTLLWAVVTDTEHLNPLGSNATSVLLALFGGLIGVLGAYIGFRTGQRRDRWRETEGNGHD